MGIRIRISPQTLDLLDALLERPSEWRHGYALSQTIGVSSGTLYPILHGMERQGYLRSQPTLKGGRNRRVYRATPAGRKALVTARQRVQELFGEMFEHD